MAHRAQNDIMRWEHQVRFGGNTFETAIEPRAGKTKR
jgi:hypothetical protein